jgi:hypothetical protein
MLADFFEFIRSVSGTMGFGTLRFRAVLSFLLMASSQTLFAQGTRDTCSQEYVDFYTKSRPIYQSAPVSHVVPEFNTVTYSLEAKKLDALVAPESQVTNYSSELEVTGYRVTPYLALSLKRIGLGFSLDAGQTDIKFNQDYSSNSMAQKSQAVFRGLGIFSFLKLIDSKIYDLTLIGGGRSINVKHIIEPYSTNYQTNSYQRAETYHYTVNVYEVGISNDFHLLKSVVVNPWANYQKSDSSNALAQTPEGEINRDLMDQDTQIMWKSRRVIDYGIDLSLRIGRLELKLGGVLGALFTSNGTSETVKDKGTSVTLSFDHKG